MTNRWTADDKAQALMLLDKLVDEDTTIAALQEKGYTEDDVIALTGWALDEQYAEEEESWYQELNQNFNDDIAASIRNSGRGRLL